MKTTAPSPSTPYHPFNTLTQAALQLLDRLPDATLLLDAKCRVLQVNSAVVRLLGYPAEALLNGHWRMLVHPSDHQVVRAALLQQQATDGPAHFETRVQHCSGRSLYVNWSVQWDAALGTWLCTLRESAGLRVLEQRLLRAQTIAGLVHFEYDVCSDTFTYISGNVYNMLGLDPKHTRFSSDLLWRVIHPEDREPVRQQLLHPKQKLTHSQHQYRVLRSDGSTLVISHNRELLYDAEGKHVCTHGTFQDITAQVSIQHELEASEKRYRALVSNGTDLVGILSAEGNYRYVGENVTRLLGYTTAELTGRSPFSFIHPDDVPRVQQCLARALANEITEVAPFRFQHKTGRWLWMETHVTNLLQDPDIAGLVVNSRDITEQKATHDRLQELSLIAQESMQAILITNTRHEITWANKAFTKMSGYTEAEVLGKTPQALFANEHFTEGEHEAMQRQLEQGRYLQHQVFCYARNGQSLWMQLYIQPMFNDAGEITQYLAIGKDITERKKAEAELALSEQRFKALVQEGSDLIVIVDHEGRFTYCSDSLRKVLGYEPSSLIYHNLFDYIHPDDVAETIAGIERVKTNTHMNGVRHRFRKMDGNYVWLESKGANHFANPLINGMIVNARDITDQVLLQKKLNAEVRTKQKAITSAVIKAQESERSKLGLELHDNVNQVLTTVKLYNEMYLSGYNQDRSLLERSAQYLQDCINEIRSISKRLSAPTLGKITLGDSVRDLIDSINLTNKLQICFSADGIDHLFIAEDLHLGIYRILQEALNNIIKYAHACVAEVQIRFNGQLLHLLIRDNGRGFDTDAKRSGIGITNMKTRAENLNGVFTLSSAEGAGCTINVSFRVR